MRFAYRRYDTPTESPLDGVTEIYRPEIPVRLIGSRGDLFVLGLLDTGSDSGVGACMASEVNRCRQFADWWILKSCITENRCVGRCRSQS